jgi:DNA-binding HxlR family transcriptional regulator
MRPGKKDTGCPAEITLKIISGRWKLLILHEVYFGSKRFAELRRALSGISEKILAQELKQLESDGIISRTLVQERPIKVRYAVTSLAQQLKPIISAMHDWGSMYLKTNRYKPGSRPLHALRTFPPAEHGAQRRKKAKSTARQHE